MAISVQVYKNQKWGRHVRVHSTNQGKVWKFISPQDHTFHEVPKEMYDLIKHDSTLFKGQQNEKWLGHITAEQENVLWQLRNPDEISDVAFGNLFDIADEIYESVSGTSCLTLDELDPDMVAWAKETAAKLNISWPPHLPELEELSLDRAARKAAGQ